MNEINKEVVSVTDAIGKLNHTKDQIALTTRVNRTLLYGSAPCNVSGWNYQMVQELERVGYVNTPEFPALAHLVFACARIYQKQIPEIFGLEKMLLDCFSRTDWYRLIQKRFQDFKEENKLDRSMNRDLLAAIEVLIDLCVNARIQSGALCAVMNSIDTLQTAIEQEKDQ